MANVSRFDAGQLTGPEAAAHRQQVREQGCAVCVHRGQQVFDVWTCKRGQAWPKRGVCEQFFLINQTEE